jgi:hypothetical protein
MLIKSDVLPVRIVFLWLLLFDVCLVIFRLLDTAHMMV